MKILLTGGSGDLGVVLAKQLDDQGDIPVRLDVRPPARPRGVSIVGSILDREALAKSLDGVGCVVHIAAWHGIHDFRKEKDAYDFWDLNVTGTFNVFEAAARAGIRQMVTISSESVADRFGVYGHTKVLGEEIALTYSHRHAMNVITLRPRAFIPYWNRVVYGSYVEWAKWFWGGAVHIDDVSQSVIQSIALLRQGDLPELLTLPVDGAYDFTDADLDAWDQDGPGSTFRKRYPEYVELALQHGLDPAQKPVKQDIRLTREKLGYAPRFGLANLLRELEEYGVEGPPVPEF